MGRSRVGLQYPIEYRAVGLQIEFIILQSKHHFRKHGEFQIKIGEAVIQPSSTVRNLGFYMDRYNSCETHVNSLCKRISFHIDCIGRARRFFYLVLL